LSITMKKHKSKGKLPIPPQRAPRNVPPPSPSPGPNTFDAGQEQAMRSGARQARLAPLPPDNDADDLGGM
jgi:hypothetical protein